MLEILVTVVHVIVSLILIVVVLLQAGKGAEMGAVLGGAGSQALFGGAGSGTFLSKITVYAAVLFMFTSIGLTVLHGRGSVASVMDDFQAPATVPQTAPATVNSTITAPVTGQAAIPSTEGARP